MRISYKNRVSKNCSWIWIFRALLEIVIWINRCTVRWRKRKRDRKKTKSSSTLGSSIVFRIGWLCLFYCQLDALIKIKISTPGTIIRSSNCKSHFVRYFSYTLNSRVTHVSFLFHPKPKPIFDLQSYWLYVNIILFIRN